MWNNAGAFGDQIAGAAIGGMQPSSFSSFLGKIF
jgi:hypothetical protein